MKTSVITVQEAVKITARPSLTAFDRFCRRYNARNPEAPILRPGHGYVDKDSLERALEINARKRIAASTAIGSPARTLRLDRPAFPSDRVPHGHAPGMTLGEYAMVHIAAGLAAGGMTEPRLVTQRAKEIVERLLGAEGGVT